MQLDMHQRYNAGNRTDIIFTDLDGTLLDENYSYEDALPVLSILKVKKIPVIFCSAKTRAEQEVYHREMKIREPFIVENGSAIFIPRGYFGERRGMVVDNYEVIIMGTTFEEIIKAIGDIKEKYKIMTYHDMSNEEVAEVTGLDLEGAKLAKLTREFSETVIEADEEALEGLKKKFNVVFGGKFIGVLGKGADKGKCVKLLTEMFRYSKEIVTLGIGNSYNDEPMLRAVDIPAIVKNSDGKWADLDIENVYKSNGIGPKGWAEVVKKFILDK